MAKIKLKTKHKDIEYEEYARSYVEHYSVDSQMATRVLAVAWNQRKLWREDMLGWSENVGGSLSRKIPDQHPDDKRLWCVDVQMMDKEGQHEQDPTAKGMPKYGMAVYQCVYRNLPYRVCSDDDLPDGLAKELNRYVIRKPKFAFEMQKVPGVDLCITIPGAASNPTPLGEVPSLPISVIALEYTVVAVPVELVPDIVTHGETINSANFDDAKHLGDVKPGYYAPRRVRLSGFDQPRIYTDHRGTAVADLTYYFQTRQQEWNYFPSPTDGTYLRAFRRSDPSKSLFGESDFNDLFTFTEVE